MAAHVVGNSLPLLSQQNNGEQERCWRKEKEANRRTTATKKQMFFLPGDVPFEVDVKYAPLGLLGEGAYGLVCSCINRETGENVAVKKISNTFDHETTALRTLREIQILRQISGGHVNVIALKDVMLSSSSSVAPSLHKSNFRDVYLVQELMDTDLKNVITTSGQPLAPFHVKVFMYQILQGLAFLHSNNIIHRDLKPENVLVNKSTNLVKISDFGLARTKVEDPQKMTEYVVTRWYRAPELLTGATWYGNAVDMWSAGCILAEMLLGQPLFPSQNCLAQMKMIYNFLGKKPGELSHVAECCKFKDYLKKLPCSPGTDLEKMLPRAEPQALDLLRSLLVVDPWDRLSASQALQHPYFKDLYVPSEEDSSARKGGVALGVDLFRVDDESLIRELMWEEMLYYHPEERTMIPAAI